MQKFFNSLHKVFDLALENHKKTLLIFLFLTLIFGYSTTLLKTEFSIYEIVDPAFKSTERLREMKRDYSDGNPIILFFTTKNKIALSTQELCAIKKWVNIEGFNNSDVMRVGSPFNIAMPEAEGAKLFYNAFLKLNCSNITENSPLKDLATSPWSRLITDSGTKDISVEFIFRDGANDKFNPVVIGVLLESLRAKLLSQNPNLDYYINGDASFQWHFMNMFRSDAYVNLLLLLIIILGFRFLYGTYKIGLLFITSVIITGAIAYGIMALLNEPINVLSNNIFLMICISGIEDFLFVCFYHSRKTDKDPFYKSFKKFILPGFFTSLTTMLGFGSLYISKQQIIKNFGVSAALAALCEWAVVFYLLPSLCKFIGVDTVWLRARKSKSLNFLDRLEHIKLNTPALIISLVLFLGGIGSFFYLNYDNSPRSNFPPDHPHSQSFKYMKESRGWEGSIYVVFPDAQKKNDILEATEKIQKDPNVTKIDIPFTTLDFLMKKLSVSEKTVVDRETKISDFWGRYENKKGHLRAGVYLRSIDLKDLERSVQNIEAICKDYGCWANGEAVVLDDFSKQVSETLVGSFILSLTLVMGLIIYLCVKLKITPLVPIIYSVLWCPFVVCLILGVAQFPINLITSVFLAVLVGFTGDNAIQFIFSSKKQISTGLDFTGGASVHITAFLITASSVFLLLTMVPLKMLGIFFALGFFIALVGDFWILKGLVSRKP